MQGMAGVHRRQELITRQMGGEGLGATPPQTPESGRINGPRHRVTMAHQANIDGEFAIVGEKLPRPIQGIDEYGLWQSQARNPVAGAGLLGDHRHARKGPGQRLHDHGLGLFVRRGDRALVELQASLCALRVMTQNRGACGQRDARELPRHIIQVIARGHGARSFLRAFRAHRMSLDSISMGVQPLAMAGTREAQGLCTKKLKKGLAWPKKAFQERIKQLIIF
jgi:hypothetical protein